MGVAKDDEVEFVEMVGGSTAASSSGAASFVKVKLNDGRVGCVPSK